MSRLQRSSAVVLVGAFIALVASSEDPAMAQLTSPTATGTTAAAPARPATCTTTAPQCAANEFCRVLDCGATEGRCTVKPDCFTNTDGMSSGPVCGCDGRFYKSLCTANKAAVSIRPGGVQCAPKENIRVSATGTCAPLQPAVTRFTTTRYSDTACRYQNGQLQADLIAANDAVDHSKFFVTITNFRGPGIYPTVAPTDPTNVNGVVTPGRATINSVFINGQDGPRTRTDDPVQPPQCTIKVWEAPQHVRDVAIDGFFLLPMTVTCPALQVTPTPGFMCTYTNPNKPAAGQPVSWDLVPNCKKLTAFQ